MRDLLAALFGLSAALLALPAAAQVQMHINPPPYPITTPEPWLPPKYQSPRGSTEHVVIPPPAPPPHQRAGVPPPLYVPQTGRLLPNLPNPVPSGPNGRETYQDRAARCAYQASIYGAQAGNRNTYINSCINQ